MADETKEAGHPLDQQNAIERDIQLKGSKDPDSFKMPDGRTLTEVRKANQKKENAEYQEEIQMLARRTREQSISTFHKGDKLVMTSTGNLIDVTESPLSEGLSMPTSRTTAADIETGVVQPRREPIAGSSGQSGETASSSGALSGISSSTGPSSIQTDSSGSTSPSSGQ